MNKDKKNVIEKLKAIFSAETETETTDKTETTDETVEENFAEFKTIDGKIIRVEGDALEADMKIEEVTPDGLIDMEDGEYEIADLNIILVVEGSIIKEIKEIATEDENTDTTSEEVDSENVDEEMDSAKEETAKEDSKFNEQILDLFTKLNDKFDKMAIENEELKNRFNKFSNEDSVEEIKQTLDFSKMSKSERIMQYVKKK